MSTLRSFGLRYRFYTGIGIALLIVVLTLTKTLPADANVAFFDSFFVERQVEEKSDGVTIQNLHTHTWSSFSGEIPEAVTINGISLVLLWSKTQEEGTVEAEIEVPVATELLPIDEVVPEESTLIETVSTSDSESLEEVSEEPVTEGADTVTTETEVPVTADTNEEVPIEIVPESGDNNEENLIEVESDESVMEESPSAFLQVGLGKVLALAGLIATVEAYTEGEENLSSVSAVPVSEVSETVVEATDEGENKSDAVGSTTSEQSPEVVAVAESDVVSVPLYPTLESASVQYSFDGDMWTHLGSINLLEANEATLTLGSDTFTSLESLLVRVVYLAPQDSVPIIFGNSQLKIDYAPFVTEAVVTGPSDQEPNFLVSSVKVDIAKEGVRAVLLERGGVLELWSGLIDRNGDVVIWKRLSSGNTLNESTAIDAYNETVFWFDQNGIALMAYDLENESLIGTASPSLGDNVFVLMFEERRQPFRAAYSPSTGLFQFEPVSP